MYSATTGLGDEKILKAGLGNYRGVYRDLVMLIHYMRDKPVQTIRNSVDQYLILRWPAIKKRFSTIKVLAAVIPLLGLLGTVTGMVRTFRVITMFGSGNPVLLAGGISEALLTTQSGLVLAFPVIIFLATVKNRRDKLQSRVEHTVSQLLNELEGERNGKP
jgi:biopolymer transport protein ExbB